MRLMARSMDITPRPEPGIDRWSKIVRLPVSLRGESATTWTSAVAYALGSSSGELGGAAWPLLLMPEVARVAVPLPSFLLLRYQQVSWWEPPSPACSLRFRVRWQTASPAGLRIGLDVEAYQPSLAASALLIIDMHGVNGRERGRSDVPTPPPPFTPRRLGTRTFSDAEVAPLWDLFRDPVNATERARPYRAQGFPGALVPTPLVLSHLLRRRNATNHGQVTAWVHSPLPIGSLVTAYGDRGDPRHVLLCLAGRREPACTVCVDDHPVTTHAARVRHVDSA